MVSGPQSYRQRSPLEVRKILGLWKNLAEDSENSTFNGITTKESGDEDTLRWRLCPRQIRAVDLALHAQLLLELNVEVMVIFRAQACIALQLSRSRIQVFPKKFFVVSIRNAVFTSRDTVMDARPKHI